jgi:pyridoxine 5-phosphate synthase
MTQLSVNLNKIALLRNARPIGIPSVLKAAQTCINAGAYGITVHPRPDQRHIRFSDVYELADLLQAYPTIEFNIEGNPLEAGYLEIVRQVKPTQATLVPDQPGQSTSDHGWNLTQDATVLRPIVQELQDLGTRVSLFVDPDPEQIRLVPTLARGPMRIELYTEPYATAYRQGQGEASLKDYQTAALVAQELGLGVNAGHDLNLDNLPLFLTIPNILEVSIGHALTADALDMGLFNAVKAYREVIAQAHT